MCNKISFYIDSCLNKSYNFFNKVKPKTKTDYFFLSMTIPALIAGASFYGFFGGVCTAAGASFGYYKVLDPVGKTSPKRTKQAAASFINKGKRRIVSQKPDLLQELEKYLDSWLREKSGEENRAEAKKRIISGFKNSSDSLDLSSLNLSSIPENLDRFFPHLKILDISFNRLSALSNIEGCSNLKLINCSANKLTALPHSIPKGCQVVAPCNQFSKEYIQNYSPLEGTAVRFSVYEKDLESSQKIFLMAEKRVILANEIRGLKNDMNFFWREFEKIRNSGCSELAIDKQLRDKQNELAKLDLELFHSKKITKYIDLENLWKLGVDAQDHDKGRMSYDEGTNTSRVSEPGYIDAMEAALAYMFHTVDVPMTVSEIVKLHFLAILKVVRRDGTDNSSINFPEKIIYRGRQPLQGNVYITREGLEEMITYDFFDALFYDDEGEIFYVNSKSEENRRNIEKVLLQKRIYGVGQSHDGRDGIQILLGLIKEYNEKIKDAKTDKEKILAIATFAKKLETLHLFLDGNLRTNRLIVHKLLIQNKLPLTCILDPFIIEGHSSKQVADAMTRGMEIYQSLCKNRSAESKSSRTETG